MAVIITDDCIACNACEIECPNNAIYLPGENWTMGGKEYEGLTDDHTYVVPQKCTECVGFHDEPQCIPACPSNAIILEGDLKEDAATLLKRKEMLDKAGR